MSENVLLSAAVITVSDKGYKGEREDTSGPRLAALLTENGWKVIFRCMVPDEKKEIQAAILHAADELQAALILTTGGTGFAPRDVTPEATAELIERPTPGIAEAMRAESIKITPRGCLSRGAAGIRGRSLIVNLPGSEKAAVENINAVLPALRHGLVTLLSPDSADARHEHRTEAVIKAVCLSERRGTQKHPVDEIELRVDHGIVGDAHAGNWHRQVSLLGYESVMKIQPNIGFELTAGMFAENILTEGICLYKLPVGTKLTIGTALCEVTQIGKECHSDCAIRQLAGDCVMPREGIFVKVLSPGRAKAGDVVKIIE